MSFSVKVDENFSQSLKEALPKIKPELQKVLNNTTAFGLQTISNTLPKRSGILRKSYNKFTDGELSRRIESTLQYAVSNEEGSGRHTIKPKRAKVLLIPLRDSVLTGTKAQISQSAKSKLFAELKKPGKRSPRQIFEQVGIAMAKKADIPARSGTHLVENKVVPKMTEYMTKECQKVLDRIL